MLVAGACYKNARQASSRVIGARMKGHFIDFAATQESEYHSYSTAWGLGNTENNDSWTWFFEKLKEIIHDNSELCFISDRNQSISYTVSHVYPMVQHGACFYQVMMNIKNRFKSPASLRVFKNAAEAYRLVEFEKHLSNMYEVMTTNIVKTLNNMMLKAREYPIIAMIDFVLFTMGQWFFTRCRESVLVTTPITLKREVILRRRFDEAGSLTPYQLNENEYIVMGGNFSACFNLTTRSCTCRVFDIDKISCIHAIVAAETIHLVPPESQWHNIPEEI
ncbi:hypothetical protein TIFTF001_015349 [Ficus carica]|uniref:SWIM-type domain-containing protein n=1 Tax=Ficus carica TaxID=3494 RepID=A0AA88A5N1_FICCA|nr:hypothetical protein TIFTF001_015349 [Ficus carica]